MPDTPTSSRRPPRAQHLLVCAHGPTEDLRRARFGGVAPLSHPELTPPVVEPVHQWWCGPELACQETLTHWGVAPTPVVTSLRGPDSGTWAGLTLDEVGGAHPEELRTWMRDPRHPPPGGESLAALVERLRSFSKSLVPIGWSGVVTTPLVARALLVGALDAPIGLVSRIELSPGGRALLSRPTVDDSWHLRRLT